MKHSDYICIGRFTKPFGIEGYVRFESYSGETEHLQNIRTVTLPTLGETLEITEWLTTRPMRCKIKGIDTPEDVKRISGATIEVPRTLATTLQHDEYYLADMTGISILFEGKKHGEIVGVITDAYAPLIEIRWDEQKTHSYIPFTKKFFASPDMDLRTLELLDEDMMHIMTKGSEDYY